MFGKREIAQGYQTMNNDDDNDNGDDQYDMSQGVSEVTPATPGIPDIESEEQQLGGANEGSTTTPTPADGEIETGKSQENWNTESDDDEEVSHEEVVEDDDDSSFEEEIVEEDDEEGGGSSYYTEEVSTVDDDGDGFTGADGGEDGGGNVGYGDDRDDGSRGGGFPDAAPMPGEDSRSVSSGPRDPEGLTSRTASFGGDDRVSQTKAPSPPEAEPEQSLAPVPAAAASDQRVRAPSGILSQRAKGVKEAEEDRFLSSMNGLVCMGILIFLLLTTIVLGTGLGVAKPWEKDVVSPPPSSTASPSPTEYPTLAPVSVSPEDQELLDLLETVVGDVVYEEGTPYFEAAQWMLYRDPSRATSRRYSRRELQQDDSSYTDEERDFVQRYLLVFLWYATTNNGEEGWLSCNPVRPTFTDEDCEYQKAIRRLPSGEIQYKTVPWTRWLSGAEECNWAGVTCASTSSGRLAVTAIDLGKY